MQRVTRRAGGLVAAGVMGLMGVGGEAYAQGRAPASAPARTEQPGHANQPTRPGQPSRPGVRKDAKAVLNEARAAMGAVQALSYEAKVTGAPGGPTYEAVVSAKRAEVGGWLLYTKGTATASAGAGGESGAARTFEIGYDAANARSVREDERVVYEKTVLEWEDLETFLGTQGARPVVAWEVMGESVLEKGADKAVYEGQETIGGEVCDVVFVPDAEAAAQAPGAPGRTGQQPNQQPGRQPAPQPNRPGTGPASAPGQGAANEAKGVRYAFAVSDRLARRIERVGMAGGTQRLEMSKVAKDGAAVAGVYALPIPSGYRIRDPDAARARDGGPTPRRILGDPENRQSRPAGPLAVGAEAPAFDLKDPSGKPVKLADFAGKVVVLDFWGTWCGWCVKAMPMIEKVHQRYKDKGVVVIGMNTENDPRADPAGFMRRNKYTYRLALNAEKVTREYQVTGYPLLYVVGKDGKIAAVEVGYSDDLDKKLSEVIDRLLKE
jgi:thiol-disulfide isomerase/thioredoxin